MTTIAQLKSDIAAWTVRDDLSPVLNSFILLAEAEINRVVAALEQETDATLSFSAPEYEAALPNGFLGFKRISVSDAPTAVEFMPPTAFHEFANTPNDGFSERSSVLVYTIETNKLKIVQATGSSEPVTLSCTYIKRFDPLTDSNTSNWLLATHYDIYLFGCLKQAWDYIDETEMVAKYQGRFERSTGQLEKQEIRKRTPSGPLRARPAVNRRVV